MTHRIPKNKEIGERFGFHMAGIPGGTGIGRDASEVFIGQDAVTQW
jgi:hypothetical protein